MDKKNVLFVTEKYCERGDLSDSNLTNNFQNTFETIDASDLFNREHLWLDVGAHINDQLMDYFSEERDIQYVIFSYLGCDSSVNPSTHLISKLKEYYPGLHFIFIWWDASHPCNQAQIRELDKYASLQINIDGTDLSNITDKSVFYGCPQTKRLFYPDEQIYGITFAGKTDGYAERQEYLHRAISYIPINIVGGRTQQKLTPEEYARILRQSKININFCNTPHGFVQCKGRVWEILSSKTLLLEQDNPITAKYLRPYKDYVPFSNPRELIEKAQYYLGHEEERQAIIDRGYERFKNEYSAEILWNRIYNL